MTIAVGVQPRRSGGLVAVLTLSLVVNVFLIAAIAGTVVSARNDRPAGARFEAAAAGLQLDSGQQTAFRQYMQVLRQRSKAMHDVNQLQWSELSDLNTDKGQIAALLSKAVQSRTASQEEVATSLTAFLSSLTPQQRVAFIDALRKETQAGRGPMQAFRRLFQ